MAWPLFTMEPDTGKTWWALVTVLESVSGRNSAAHFRNMVKLDYRFVTIYRFGVEECDLPAG